MQVKEEPETPTLWLDKGPHCDHHGAECPVHGCHVSVWKLLECVEHSPTPLSQVFASYFGLSEG